MWVEKLGRGRERRGREGPLVLAYTPWCEILDKILVGCAGCRLHWHGIYHITLQSLRLAYEWSFL